MRSPLILETTDHLRPRIIALIALGVVIVTVISITVMTLMTGSGLPDLGVLFSSDNVTPLTLLIAGFGSGLFFIPIPTEFIYLYGVR